MAILNERGLERLWSHIIAKLGGKVDKEEGMGLSSNDFTAEEKNKLAGIAEGATNVTVDGELNSESLNPVQNRILYATIENLASKEYVDEKISNMSNNTQNNSLTLIDAVTGNIYKLAIQNGILISYLTIEEIQIMQEPNQTIYYAGEVFDPTGMHIIGITAQGDIVDITDYTYSTAPLITGDTEVIISYNYYGEIFSIAQSISVYEEFDPERDLIDFIYETVDNGDGTYSYYLVEWRGTYLGEPSTKMVIPNHSSVVIPGW